MLIMLSRRDSGSLRRHSLVAVVVQLLIVPVSRKV